VCLSSPAQLNIERKVFGLDPMNAADGTRELEEIANAGDDFDWQSGQLTAKWEGAPKGFEAVEPILRFIKKHPDVDYGTPGPLVHFVETFPNYEEKLIQSVERQPTPNTVGMLNRVINGKHTDAMAGCNLCSGASSRKPSS
jgi:hypothetical protein